MAFGSLVRISKSRNLDQFLVLIQPLRYSSCCSSSGSKELDFQSSRRATATAISRNRESIEVSLSACSHIPRLKDRWEKRPIGCCVTPVKVAIIFLHKSLRRCGPEELAYGKPRATLAQGLDTSDGQGLGLYSLPGTREAIAELE